VLYRLKIQDVIIGPMIKTVSPASIALLRIISLTRGAMDSLFSVSVSCLSGRVVVIAVLWRVRKVRLWPCTLRVVSQEGPDPTG
jgi:hypothetical protein